MLKIILGNSLICRTASLCSILYLLFGCAAKIKPFPENVRKQISHVAIVPAKFEPQIDYHPDFAKGRDAGAAKGVATGMATGALFGTAVAIESLIGILLLPYFAAGGAIIGGTVGGIGGAFGSVPEEKAKQTEETVDNALAELDLQGTMAERIYKAGGDLTGYEYVILKGIGPASPEEILDYRTLNLKGVDIILEVRVNRLGFKGGKGSNPYISLDMKVNVKTINAVNGEEIYSGIWSYVSRERPLSEWAENNAQRLHDEFERCYNSLAENIVEKNFLMYEFHFVSPFVQPYTCGLTPFYPEYDFHLSNWGGPEVDSLQPTLWWEAFPSRQDRESDKKGILDRIEKITYDLKIWKAEDFVEDKPIYVKKGLEKPEHKIEILLEPSKQYFWAFRARFMLDNQHRLTKWSYSRTPWPAFEQDPCTFNSIPITNYLRFITPFEKENQAHASVSQGILEVKVEAQDGYFQKLSSGIVLDTHTGLEWVAGPDKDVDSNQAQLWINKLTIAGGGWRLPAIWELKTLFKRGLGDRNMTLLLKTTGWNVWSSEAFMEKTDEIQAFEFSRGTNQLYLPEERTDMRCFAVRSRKE